MMVSLLHYFKHSLCCKRMVFSGTSAKLRVATIKLRRVCPSIRSHGTTRLPPNGIFTKYENFRKYARNIHVLLTSDKNSGHFTWRPMYILIVTRSVLRISLTKVVEKIKTHFLYNNLLLPGNRAVYKMWTNRVLPDRPQMTIERMSFACWVTKITNTHSKYVILIAFPLQQWLNERA